MALHLPPESFLHRPGPLVDVRSPGEFDRGHIPGAVNLPLFSDGQRAEVGTTYKQVGRQEAVRLGLRLVGPRLDGLAGDLMALAQADGGSHPLRLLCWRGGMRSASVAWLASTLELPVELLEGGYKAYRRWVLELFERPWPLRLLGGRTGSGKTELLLALAARGVAVVDLEGLAHHRGSSFGGLGLPPQPSTEHFENLLAASLQGHHGAPEIWLEAESAQVGRCRIPIALFRQMEQAPMLEVARPLGERLRRLVAEYGHQDPRALEEATRRIARRLGPQRTQAALAALGVGDWGAACAEMLDYYDRCYDHGLSHRSPGAPPGQSPVDLGEVDGSTVADTWLVEGRVRPAA